MINHYWYAMFNKNLLILIFCQFLGTSGSVLLITIGGIIGSELAPNKALATLPVTLLVLGTALSTYPASMIMQAIGRRKGFALASMVSCLALMLCAWSLIIENFYVYCVTTLLFGFNQAFVMQYRFGAAESVAKKDVSKAVSWVLVGSIGGAFLGPALLTYSGYVSDVPYVGSLLGAAILYIISSVLLLQLKGFNSASISARSSGGKSLKELFSSRYYTLAVLAGLTAQGVMVLIMTATPISMHLHHGHSMEDTAMVIRSHVLAMYIPSLVAGYLISLLGIKKMMIIGCLLFLTTVFAGLSGQGLFQYWITLVLLGVGWNFLFVGGTTLLTTTYADEDKFRAQGINDLSVFGGSALASLLAGTILHYSGWNTLLLLPLPILVLMMFYTIFTRNLKQAP